MVTAIPRYVLEISTTVQVNAVATWNHDSFVAALKLPPLPLFYNRCHHGPMVMFPIKS